MAANTPAQAPMGLFAQITSYPKAFWYANLMEMVERWAYYGVRLSLALYIVGATALGGLEFTHIQKGNIYLWWAIISSFLPMFTGGLADRYGYKKCVAIAVAMKIAGYALMATQTSYGGFFAGCMLLAAGTGLFKPGVQGLIAHSVKGANASVGWGIFYELVNVGAWIAGLTVQPLKESALGLSGATAATMAATPGYMNFTAIFLFNTALVCLNFLPLLMFKEPDVPRPAPYKTAVEGVVDFFKIIASSVTTLVMNARLLVFVLIFSGFWFSFHQLFDLLPNFIDDWTTFASTPSWYQTKDGSVNSAEILNLNSFLIMLFMIPVAYVASKFQALNAIIIGMVAAIAGIYVSGFSQSGTYVILGVAVFTLGEMLSSPRTNDYLASIAPSDQKGLYLGYAQVPSGIGWAAGSYFAGHFYEDHGDKVNFARHWLETEGGMTAEAVKAVPKEKVMETLAEHMHTTIPLATQKLWELNHPYMVWYWIAGVGIVSLVGMIVYNLVVSKMGPAGEAVHLVPAAAPAGDGVPVAPGALAEQEQELK